MVAHAIHFDGRALSGATSISNMQVMSLRRHPVKKSIMMSERVMAAGGHRDERGETKS